MIREINVKEITRNIKEMCIEANYTLSPDMDKAMKKAAGEENCRSNWKQDGENVSRSSCRR